MAAALARLLALAALPPVVGQEPCVVPTTIPFAAFPPCKEGDIIGFLATCTPRCQDGFTPVVSGPDTVLVCGFSGQLSPAAFACTEERCPAPAGVENAAPAGPCAEGAFITSREFCVTQCDHGYYPSERNLSCYRGNLTPPTFRCVGLPCDAPTGILNGHEESNCAETRIFHDRKCTTRCSTGYVPSIPELNCSLGNLTPRTFDCLGRPCPAPVGIPNAADPACAEGPFVNHTKTCTTRCSEGYGPEIPSLLCTATQLSPPEFVCLGLPCAAPLGIVNAADMPCEEGPSIPNGGACTTRCATGYVPSVPFLSCGFAALSPPSFTCLGLGCEMPKGIPNAAPLSCEEGELADHLGNCTTSCAFGYAPTVPVLECEATVLTPPLFGCVGLPCDAPVGIEGAAAEPCAEGAILPHGGVCTAQCLPGYVPMVQTLSCNASTLRPSLFDCVWAGVLEETTPAKGAIVSLGTAQYVAAAALSSGRALVCYKDIPDLFGLRGGRCNVIYASVASVLKGPDFNISAAEVAGLMLAEVGEDVVVACYREPEREGRGTCKLLAIANTTITVGDELVVCAGPAWHLALSRLADSLAAVCCQGSGSLGCRVLASAGMQLVEGPVAAVGNGSAAYLAVAQLADGKAAVCLSDALRGRRVHCHALAAFGHSLVAGSGAAVGRGAAHYVTMASLGADKATTRRFGSGRAAPRNKAAVCFSDWSDSEHCSCSLLLASGQALSEGASSVVLQGLTRHHTLAALGDGRAVVCYQFEAWFGRSYGHCTVLNAPGNASLEGGGDVLVNAGTTWNLAAAKLGPDTALVCFSDTSHSEYGKCRVLWGLREWVTGEAAACSAEPSEPLCTA